MASFLDNVQGTAMYEDVTGTEASDLATQAVTDIASTGTHLSSGAALDYTAQRVQKTPGDVYAVSVPIVGGGAAHGSSVTAIYTAAKQKAGVVEIQLHEITENSGRTQVWADGVQRFDEVVTADYPSNQGNVQARGMNWGALNNCLASLGIPAWIASGLSMACSVACFFTAGAGCIICIAGVIGFSSGAVANCVHQSWS